VPTATVSIDGGGDGGAPLPGSGGDRNGPGDDYVAGATRLNPLVSTVIGGLVVVAGLAAV